MTAARPSKVRCEGQWALGEREPLNETERFQRDDPPLDVRDRNLNKYSKEGSDSIEFTCFLMRARPAGKPMFLEID